MLSLTHRNERISFIEETHVYLIDNVHNKEYYSVTQFVHQFIQHFDAEGIINKMMTSPKWKESKYYNKTKKVILEEWDTLRETAADLGTKMHLAIEQFYNVLIDPETINDNKQDLESISTIEYGYFIDFHKQHASLVPFCTEWRIFDEVYKLAGSIDMVYLDPSDLSGKSICIYDWKRSKEIKKNNWFQKCLPPLSHLDDCNYNHYTLQLNVYKFIIERNYGLRVTQLAIVVLHPNNSNYIKIDIPFMDYEIECMMKHRLKQLENNSKNDDVS
jgi:ATP-dependent exoDNAse (exonuclease V) beta subunit